MRRSAYWVGLNRPIVLFLLHTAIAQIGLYGITDVILNFYFVSLGYQSETIGILQGLGRLGGTITGIPLGLLADRIGARKVIIICMIGVAVSYVPLVFVPTLPMLILGRLIFGGAFGAVFLASSPLMITLSRPEHRTRVFSMFSIAGLSATALGSALGGFLPSLVVKFMPLSAIPEGIPPEQSIPAYSASLAIAGLLCVVSITPLLLFRDPPPATHPDGTPKTGRGSVRTTSLRDVMRMVYLSLPMVIFGITAGFTFPFYNLLFRVQFSLSDNVVGTILGFGWLIMGVSTILAVGADRRWGRVRASLVVMITAGCAFFVLGGAQTLWLGIIAFVVAVSVRNLLVPLYQPLYMESFAQENHNIASALNSILWNGGWFAASAVGGSLIHHNGFGTLLALVGTGVILTGVSIFLIFRKRKPHPELIPA